MIRLQRNGQDYTEAKMNGFPETATADRFEGGEYRFLIVASKFQTGFDHPKLVAMVVDKKHSGALLGCRKRPGVFPLQRAPGGEERKALSSLTGLSLGVGRFTQPFMAGLFSKRRGRRRDADGRISGSSAESPSGRTTHRDGSGRIVSGPTW